ncbi:MAG: sodium/proline symporter, partial [Rhodothermia bacterium]
RDLYQQIFHPEISDDHLTGLSRIVTLALAGAALLIALVVSFVSPDRTVFWYVIFGWSGIAATFCPTLILTLFFPRFTVGAAIAAMLTGMLAVPFFQFAAPLIPVIGSAAATVGEMAPSFGLSLIVGIFVSTTQTD